MKHLFKILELIFAIISSAILLPLGLIYNIWELIRFKRNFWVFAGRFLYEMYLIVTDICEKIAVIIDRIGNIILGNLFTRIFVKKEFRKQLSFNPYGRNEWTISASTGYFEAKLLLNEKGLEFSKILSDVLGKNHCIQAYNFHKLKEEFNSKTGIS